MRIIKGFDEAKSILTRRAGQGAWNDAELEKTVSLIVEDVRQRGDAALYDYTRKFDGVKLASLEVDKEVINRACRSINKELLAAMKLAAERIKIYHLAQKKMLLRDNRRAKLGWLIRSIERIGIYVPGGTAPLPSTLLMTVIPARVAGVKEIIMVTPPQKESGEISPVTLAAAKIAGVNRVFSVGGAQAIVALAYGTKSIPAVDKIYGPGNMYVTMAKKIVFGTVGIDGLYGPSEVIIIADATANAAFVAADLLAQAEHGSLATAILIATSMKVAYSVNHQVENQLKTLARRDIAAAGLEKKGLMAVVKNVDEAIDLANLYAPEHLCLVVDKAASYINKVKNAGCLFIGENSLEALVDYAAGPSHVLPTEGTARFGSGLNTLDFIKVIDLVKMDKSDIKRLGRAAMTIAQAEGLDAHARAVARRLNDTG
ncbi:MAG: histidinol dehydrogenase [Dehalococcoidales bacterium]|jgi:histidinol dehydrogenase